MKYYLATAFVNKDKYKAIVNSIDKQFRHKVTYNWFIEDEQKDKLTLTKSKQISCNEIEGVRTADVVMVLLPGGKGTHAELGMALAFDKPVILFTPQALSHNEINCQFYWHYNVYHAVYDQNLPIDDLARFMCYWMQIVAPISDPTVIWKNVTAGPVADSEQRCIATESRYFFPLYKQAGRVCGETANHPSHTVDDCEDSLPFQNMCRHHDFQSASPIADSINHPSHYTFGKIEVKDVIEDWDFNFYKGNALKYLARAGRKKQETELEDLRKAIKYIEFEIERLSKKEKK